MTDLYIVVWHWIGVCKIRGKLFYHFGGCRSLVSVDRKHHKDALLNAFLALFAEIFVENDIGKDAGHLIFKGSEIVGERLRTDCEFVENTSHRPNIDFVIV